MILAVVQARMGSERLPGKVMERIGDRPLVEHVIRRTQQSEHVDAVCVAIPDTPDNDPLAAHLEGLGGIRVYRGSESDVLGRVYNATQLYGDNTHAVVRITADDPFKDPALIDYAVQGFLTAWAEPDEEAGRPHYLHLGGDTWPYGLDVEVVTMSALTLAHQHATDNREREHVTPWIADAFGVWVLKNPREHGSSEMRWTVDTPEQLEFAREVYDVLGPDFGYDDMIGAGL